MSIEPRPIVIELEDSSSVSGLVLAPPSSTACFVFAHGAGAGMNHPSMAVIADGLAERDIATLRFQFPYMEKGSKRPDDPATAHAAVRAAVAHASKLFDGTPLFAGGKSFGGRMTSQAQASTPLPGVRGLVFLGFPLHPSDKPSITRAKHLDKVEVPMLFVQGTRDKLAQFELIEPVVSELGPRATLMPIREADHSFHVLVRSGRKNDEVMTELLDGVAAWITKL
jgi:predicted alpha/beta-hydrolase family hydrolase